MGDLHNLGSTKTRQECEGIAMHRPLIAMAVQSAVAVLLSVVSRYCGVRGRGLSDLTKARRGSGKLYRATYSVGVCVRQQDKEDDE
jgi:hypothetical protein